MLETLNDSGEVVYRMALDSSGSLKVYVMTTDPVTGNKERVETTDIPTGRFQLYTDGLSFCGLKVTYTDTDGYVSVIQTDIRVKMPDMDFAQAVTLPSITESPWWHRRIFRRFLPILRYTAPMSSAAALCEPFYRGQRRVWQG